MTHLDPRNFTVFAHHREIRAVHPTHGLIETNFLGLRVKVPAATVTPMRLVARAISVDLIEDHELEGNLGKLLIATTEMGDALFFIPNSMLPKIGLNPKDWVNFACASKTPWGLTVALLVNKSTKDL